jgi:hypothetical protein
MDERVERPGGSIVDSAFSSVFLLFERNSEIEKSNQVDVIDSIRPNSPRRNTPGVSTSWEYIHPLSRRFIEVHTLHDHTPLLARPRIPRDPALKPNPALPLHLTPIHPSHPTPRPETLQDRSLPTLVPRSSYTTSIPVPKRGSSPPPEPVPCAGPIFQRFHHVPGYSGTVDDGDDRSLSSSSSDKLFDDQIRRVCILSPSETGQVSARFFFLQDRRWIPTSR